MKANRIHRFGAPEVIVFEEVPRPTPGEGEVLVRVQAAGVGPWDGWIRAGKSVLPQPLPLTLGSDLAGRVEAVGPGVTAFAAGDEVYGVTNPRFTGAHAEWAVASVAMLARKPRSLDWVAAASIPVVAVTAWQMLFDHAAVTRGQTVLVHGGSGNVGAYAVQLARRAGARVFATAAAAERDYVHRLGAEEVIDARETPFEDELEGPVDVVIDTVGGEVLQRSLAVVRPGGIVVSAVSEPDAAEAARRWVRAHFILVDTKTEVLTELATRVDAGELTTRVGEVLPLAALRQAHESLEGTRPRPRGKMVLQVG